MAEYKLKNERAKLPSRVGGNQTPDDIRADILTRATAGEITPEQAEAEWRPCMQGLLAYEPFPEQHDPFKLPAWTLSMALAWIVTRDQETVMWFDDYFRAKVKQWQKAGDGWHPTELNPMAMVLAEMELADDAKVGPDYVARKRAVHDAKADLKRRLAYGSITASAVALPHNAVVVIPAHEWSRLVFCMDRWRDELCFEHNLSAVYRRVQLPTAQILKCWAPKPAALAAGRAAAQAQEELAAIMAASPHTQTITKSAWVDQIGKALKLSPTKAKSIWKSCSKIHPDWRKSGPKSRAK